MKIIENRYKFIAVPVTIMLIGILCMIYNGVTGNGFLNFDVDFKGGTSIQLDLGKEFNNDDVAKIVTDITGQEAPQVQKVVGTTQVLIKTTSLDAAKRTALIKKLTETYGVTSESANVSDVSATVSNEMQTTALLAVGVSCLAMLVYISFRFRNVIYGGSAILALLNDALVVLAAYAIFRIPVDYSFIAALLTVIGFSINSTIVIFDRMRENKKIHNRIADNELVNSSVTQTLRRSIFTTTTTLIALLCLYIFGVSSIRNFTLPIIIGIVCGLYSSVFVSGSLWYTLKNMGKKEARV